MKINKTNQQNPLKLCGSLVVARSASLLPTFLCLPRVPGRHLLTLWLLALLPSFSVGFSALTFLISFCACPAPMGKSSQSAFPVLPWLQTLHSARVITRSKPAYSAGLLLFSPASLCPVTIPSVQFIPVGGVPQLHPILPGVPNGISTSTLCGLPQHFLLVNHRVNCLLLCGWIICVSSPAGEQERQISFKTHTVVQNTTVPHQAELYCSRRQHGPSLPPCLVPADTCAH